MINLLIADDDANTIDNLLTYFSYVEDIDVIATATNGHDALEQCIEMGPSVVLSDIHMPEMGGLELLRKTRELEKPPTFIAMTGIDTDGAILETLISGGSGYIVKSQSVESIVQAIYDALEGGTSLSPQSLARLVHYIPLASSDNLRSRGGAIQLTAIENQVLACLCEGMANSEIAEKLGYAESSIKRHVTNLMRYFNCPSRLKLVLTALRSGWI